MRSRRGERREGRTHGTPAAPDPDPDPGNEMDWTDDAIVLSTRRHGESAAVVSLLTRARGRHAGLVRGGFGRGRSGGAARAALQPGTAVSATWRARLSEHLGSLTCEPVRSHAAPLLDDVVGLAALASACAVLDSALPEREPHAGLYEALDLLLSRISQGPGWEPDYVRWEAALLAALGYGLDLTACAATGATTDLTHVSPRTGRAVSRAAAEPYRDRLLPLPAFLSSDPQRSAQPSGGDLSDGLKLTGHFLAQEHFALLDRSLPPARERLVTLLQRRGKD